MAKKRVHFVFPRKWDVKHGSVNKCFSVDIGNRQQMPSDLSGRNVPTKWNKIRWFNENVLESLIEKSINIKLCKRMFGVFYFPERASDWLLRECACMLQNIVVPLTPVP